MNLFLKSNYKCLIFFLFITGTLPAFSSYSTDSTLNFTPRVHQIRLPFQPDRQPFLSFATDSRGVIYLGKKQTLFIISGKDIFQKDMKGPVYVTASSSGDSIYYACDNDFGIIRSSGIHAYTFSSLYTGSSQNNYGFTPTGIVAGNEGLFIPAGKEVLCYVNDSLTITGFENEISRLILQDSMLYALSSADELFSFQADGFSRLIFSPGLPSGNIISLDGGPEIINIITGSGIDYLYRRNNNVYHLTGEKAISTPGLLARGKAGRDLSYTISQEKGLRICSSDDRSCYILGPGDGYKFTDLVSAGADDRSNIWFLLQNGLYRVDNPALFSTVRLEGQIGGRINAMLVNHDRMYIAGSSGLFIINSSDLKMERVSGTAAENLYLLSGSGTGIFMAGNKHLYELVGKRAVRIDNGLFYHLVSVCRDTILAVSNEGLLFYTRKASGGWNMYTVDPLLDRLHSLICFKDHLWFVSDSRKVYQTGKDFRHDVPRLVASFSQTTSLRLLGETLYAQSADSMFRFSETEDHFVPSEQQEEFRWLVDGEQDIHATKDRNWIITRHMDRPGLWSLTMDTGKLSANVFPFASELDDITGAGLFEHYLWLTDNQNLYRLDLLADSLSGKKSPGLLISYRDRVRLFADSVTSVQQSVKRHRPDLRFRYRERQFKVTILPDGHIPAPCFYTRYRILPASSNWSEWQVSEQFSVPLLKPGKYLLEVQLIDAYGQISAPASLAFQIRVPFFRHWLTFFFYFILAVILVFLINKWRLLSMHRMESRAEEKVKDQINELVREKAKSDKLVADMFPKTTAEELKTSGRAKWDKYEMATVLFSDIQGFTKIAEHMNPELLIDELDKFFFHFDSVVEKFNIEKIKTIGDAYMAAGGIPEKNSTNPVEVVLAALEMQQYMLELKKTNADIWDLRIGIHTGPVIAGVVGHKKLSYDIWGDTVNTASRMESSGIAGKVNISGTTYSLVKDYFICEYRGKLPVKYKGNIDMYFVNSLRPELTVDLAGLPNKRFNILVQSLRLNDLEEKVFETYYDAFDARYHFHTAAYITRYLDQVRLLCRAESLDEEDTLICLSAALLFYSGLSQSYENFENRSALIARELLPAFRYGEKQIDRVVHTILGAKVPFEPVSILEKILIDARMEYLSRPDLPSVLKTLYNEAQENEIKADFSTWRDRQIELLNDFQYYTLASKRLREVQPQDQIRIIKDLS